MKNNKKVLVLASVLLFSGFLLGGNSQVVKAAGENDTSSAPTSDSGESSMEGSNVTTSDDGTVSADITYNGVQYSVKGKIGTTVKANPVDGSSTDSINVSITDRKFSNSSNIKLNLDGPEVFRHQIFNALGQPVEDEYKDGLQSFQANQEMKTQDGNIYYRIDDGEWIQQNTGVTLDGEFENNSYKESPYFVVSKITNEEITYDDPKSVDDIVDKDGIVSGTFTEHSDKYNKDFEYTFSGEIGKSVIAALRNADDEKYDLNPVKVHIFNDTSDGHLYDSTMVSLAGTDSKNYKLYNIQIDENNEIVVSKAARALAGGLTYSADQIQTDRDGNVYYRVSMSEWVKKDEGVSPDPNRDIPIKPYIKIVQSKITADVTIPSNLGDKKVSDVSGEVGDDVTVTVPTVSGYKADKSTVSAHVNEDGTITTKDSVKYTPIKSGSGSSSDTENVKPEYLKQTVSTFPDKPNVKLYHLNADSMTADDTRVLAPNSDWQSDQRVVVKGDTYYRVATNEWVKASQVYVYTAHPIIVETKSNGIKKLASAEGNTVTDRALASDTDWYSDRIAYLNDGTTEYYRVATNEFVKQSDVNEINK